MRAAALAVLWAGLFAAAACDVEWGGGRLSLEDPAPAPEVPEPRDAAEPAPVPLPEGPLLYVVRPRPDGRALVVPAARLDGPPEELLLPDAAPDRWRARFDSVFLGAGTELHVHSAGERIGTVVLDGTAAAPDASCPSVGTGTLLAVPGQRLPLLAYALPSDIPPPQPGRVVYPAPDRRMAVTGPVIAERLIPERAFLAQRASLKAVPYPGDAVPAMAGTWLVNDALAPGPPAGEATSLFFLARFDPDRGYVTVWSELRRYADASAKEAFEYLDWLRVPGGRLDVLRRVDGASEGLAASLGTEAEEEAGEERQIHWMESGPCRAVALLEAVGSG